jgi:hypothetical protein
LIDDTPLIHCCHYWLADDIIIIDIDTLLRH